MMRVEVTGTQEVIAALRGIDAKLRKKILQQDMAEAGREIRDAAKGLAPRSTDPRLVPGLLRLSLDQKTKTYSSGVVVTVVGPRTNEQRDRKSKTRVPSAFGKRAAKKAAKHGGALAQIQKPSKYAHLAGPGRHQQFMTEASQSAVPQAVKRMEGRIHRGIEEAARA